MGKKKRDKKTSNGTGRGAKPVHLDELQKVLMWKGMYSTWKPLSGK